MRKPPLIVIPGIMGSRLVDRTTGNEVLPGSLVRFVLGEDHCDRLVTTLTSAGGYCVPASQATPSSDCLLMAWYRRRDLVDTAAELKALVDRLIPTCADQNPSAHSRMPMVIIFHGGR